MLWSHFALQRAVVWGVRWSSKVARSRGALIGAALLIVLGSSAHAADAARPPNVILILADDLGWGSLGSYGQEKIQTPHLDRLAREGMRFTQCYAGSNVCQPSRCVLMTGRHTGHSSIRANNLNQHLLDEEVTIADSLKAKGYATGVFGKWGLGFEGTAGHPNRQGFDEHFGQLLQVHAHFYYPYWAWHNDERVMFPGNEKGGRRNYISDETQTRAVNFVKANKDRPFFLYLPHIIPHVEMAVPEDSLKPYLGKFPKRSAQDGRAGYISTDDAYTVLAGMIARLDGYVGEILALLAELKIDDNTIVIFTSDNGAQNGAKDGGWTAMTDFFRNNASFRGYKGQWYEGGIRVPLLARWPGRIPAGRTSDRVVGFQDMLPTLAEICSTETPADLDGVSFALTLLAKGEQTPRNGLYWEYRVARGISRAARIGDWKAIQNGPDAKVELYDLSSDVSEKSDVAVDHPDVVERLTKFMDQSRREPHPFPNQKVAEGIEAFVR